ncbi:hypothetical protein PRJ_0555 [Pseudomonas sp. XWY-1]|nr:hypothetical protein PRJ_0555 [Pseudomonas sp. XWY-1]
MFAWHRFTCCFSWWPEGFRADGDGYCRKRARAVGARLPPWVLCKASPASSRACPLPQVPHRLWNQR